MIPAYNEEATIGPVVAGSKHHTDLVIVVDDGSEDKTAEIAEREGAFVVKHPFNMGVGAAVSTGFRIALTYNPSIIITLDGDGQHDPDDIPVLLKCLRDSQCDMVIGSRLLSGYGNMPFYKRIGNWVVTEITRIMAGGGKITDSQSGFRAYYRRALESSIHDSAGYPYASEIIVAGTRMGFRIVEVPIKARYPKGRRRGTSISDGLRIALHTLISRKRRS